MLIRSLGAKCAECGTEDMSLLSIDHVDGIRWDRYALRYDARIEAYLREWVEEWARLRVLCVVCNGRFGAPSREPGEDDVDGESADSESADLEDAPF
jgi:hypothetical protein